MMCLITEWLNSVTDWADVLKTEMTVIWALLRTKWSYF